MIVLAAGRVQLADDIDHVLATHRLLVGPRREPDSIAHLHRVLRVTHTPRETTLLVRTNGRVWDQGWEVHDLSFEEIVLAYLGLPDETDRSAGEPVEQEASA